MCTAILSRHLSSLQRFESIQFLYFGTIFLLYTATMHGFLPTILSLPEVREVSPDLADMVNLLEGDLKKIK